MDKIIQYVVECGTLKYGCHIILFSVQSTTVRRKPCFSYNFLKIDAIRVGGGRNLSIVFIQSRTDYQLCTDCLLQAISDSKSFTVSEHFHI